MTIETITALIHEHMYDRLNESNNSNDGKEIKHVQERPYKRKWTDKTDQDKSKRRPENQRYKQRDKRCGQSNYILTITGNTVNKWNANDSQ